MWEKYTKNEEGALWSSKGVPVSPSDYTFILGICLICYKGGSGYLSFNVKPLIKMGFTYFPRRALQMLQNRRPPTFSVG